MNGIATKLSNIVIYILTFFGLDWEDKEDNDEQGYYHIVEEARHAKAELRSC